jgi:hypothetical protein
LKCVVTGRRSLPWQEGTRFFAAVDMSGGSSDDAVLCIAHLAGKTVVLDLIVKQPGSPPFDPRYAVARFCDVLADYKISKVYGDAFAGQTFRSDFQKRGVTYEVRSASASDLYERLEPVLNAGELELLDAPTLIEQFVSLVWRGNKITHEHGAHDDHATAAALAVRVVREAIMGDDAIPIPRIPELVGTNDSRAGIPPHYLRQGNRPYTPLPDSIRTPIPSWLRG